MLIKTSIFNLTQLDKQSTLSDIKLDCMNDFCQKIRKMYVTDYGKNYNSIKRYEMFRSLFAQKITLNLDNLIFQKNIKITTLKNYCKKKIKDLLDINNGSIQLTNDEFTQLVNNKFTQLTNDECIQLPTDEQKITVSLTDQIKFKCTHQDLLKQMNEMVKVIDELFGNGQFPIMTLHIIKIGNIDYFYYTISR